MEFVVYAVLLGIMLSLVLIGPAFFLLIETSITKGWRSAIALDAGVVSADLLCIAFAYTGVGGIVEYIGAHPALYKIGGFIIMIYGGLCISPNLNYTSKTQNRREELSQNLCQWIFDEYP